MRFFRFVVFLSADVCLYVADPHVMALWPTTGPVRGNTVVTVTGTGFVNSVYLYCLFGTHPRLQAVWVTSTHMECLSPSNPAPAIMPIEITNNNQDFTTDAVVYEYQANPSVATVSNYRGNECTSVIVQKCV